MLDETRKSECSECKWRDTCPRPSGWCSDAKGANAVLAHVMLVGKRWCCDTCGNMIATMLETVDPVRSMHSEEGVCDVCAEATAVYPIQEYVLGQFSPREA